MFTEESFENVVIEYLKELNYDYIHGSNLTRDNKEVLLLNNLKENLININKETVAKKIHVLREDIDLDDDEIWDYYDDNLDNDWNKNTPNEDTIYYERLETDPLDGDVLDLNANESRVYKSIKKMMEAKIRKNPIN